MIAALGMYDRAETAAANNALWAGIRDSLRAQNLGAPEHLTRGDMAYMAGWTSPDLIFSQSCSLPYRAALFDTVTLIATPDYGLPDCPAGYYRSVYVARSTDHRADLAAFAGSAFALNEELSHSGWAAPWADHRARGLTLTPILQTGAHRASGLAVAQGQADYAALDQLTWELMCRHDDFAKDLKVIGETPISPALPFITAKTNDAASLRQALITSIAALDPDHRAALHIRGCVTIPAAVYLDLPIPPAPFAR
jgi:ABC-type phosphate/phosphonate transport system substrate-binding protein